MPLQNRVDPLGGIHAVSERGLFTGNRGVIHDPNSKQLLKRRWTTKAWIICDCGFRNRNRKVFGYNTPSGTAGWTNLFFLDEVTALAAGHRPCFECRREKAREYAYCFGKAFGIAKPKVGQIDERLHAERLAAKRPAVKLGHDTSNPLANLPQGAMVFTAGRFFAKRGDAMRGWTFAGYGEEWSIDELPGGLSLATPATTLAALAAGYQPVWHPSVDSPPS